ncbi:unannotated protein [freshwater metagenome]|uniref:Unannotated protein n=1 Tax=freshwater metagenome TaxID=449393 RepID=A0A6J7J313_9ZZZZ
MSVGRQWRIGGRAKADLGSPLAISACSVTWSLVRLPTRCATVRLVVHPVSGRGVSSAQNPMVTSDPVEANSRAVSATAPRAKRQ